MLAAFFVNKFAMRFALCHQVSAAEDGEDVAWDSIRAKLQEIIDQEDKAKPHSDDELVRRLKAAGFSVARRTVTKYRKKMGIPSSRQRKDWGKVDG